MRRKSLAIYCVTYNSYAETDAFLASVDTAAARAKDMDVTVFVADNAEKAPRPLGTDYVNISVEAFPTGGNLGYLGGAQACMRAHDPAEYDFAAISNVDLALSPTALERLSLLELPADTGWIAPRIYSTLERRDRNPKILSRYTARRLKTLRLMYSHPWLNTLYELTAYRRKRVTASGHSEGERIYAGHGSFMILTREFFRRAGVPRYPVFLFGEEIFLAEMCRRNALEVVYMPSVEILDSDHCSTGKMKSSLYYRCNREALDYILHTFYGD